MAILRRTAALGATALAGAGLLTLFVAGALDVLPSGAAVGERAQSSMASVRSLVAEGEASAPKTATVSNHYAKTAGAREDRPRSSGFVLPTRKVTTVRVTEDNDGIAPLNGNDPRWTAATAARTAASALPETVETAELRSKLERLQSAEAVDNEVQLAAAQDTTFTAGIPEPRRTSSDTVASAAIPSTPSSESGTGEAIETAALDPAADVEQEAVQAAPEEEMPAPAKADLPAPARTMKTNTAVNMRAGPDDGTKVLRVIPAGTQVGVTSDCEHWCEVVVNGKRGFIYRTFLGERKRAASTAGTKSRRKKPADPQPEEETTAAVTPAPEAEELPGVASALPKTDFKPKGL